MISSSSFTILLPSNKHNTLEYNLKQNYFFSIFFSLKIKFENIFENVGGKNVLVKLFKFAHEPGSGATTIAMNVLWNLRKEFRCVRIDALDISAISDVAEEIIG